jgi:hypothetical protein
MRRNVFLDLLSVLTILALIVVRMVHKGFRLEVIRPFNTILRI